MTEYRCIRCRKPLIQEINRYSIVCDCGSRIFYKERPNVKKIVEAI